MVRYTYIQQTAALGEHGHKPESFLFLFSKHQVHILYCLPGRTLLTRQLDPTCASVLTYRDGKPFGEYETICLCSLKEENHGA